MENQIKCVVNVDTKDFYVIKTLDICMLRKSRFAFNNSIVKIETVNSFSSSTKIVVGINHINLYTKY